jgi:hypothetical protein
LQQNNSRAYARGAIFFSDISLFSEKSQNVHIPQMSEAMLTKKNL